MTEFLLTQAKDNYLQTWNENYKIYDPLKSRDYINSTKKNGVTTLQVAIIRKDTKMVQLLTKYGADVNM